MHKKNRVIIFSLLFILLLAGIMIYAQGGATITRQQADTIMLMTAYENPQYDFCLVIDISGSMSTILEELKQLAEKIVAHLETNDTLVLIEFDDTVRKPKIKTIKTQQDKDDFIKWMQEIKTTRGRFGTDIRAAYSRALTTLLDLNEERKSKKQPIRMQYLIFISDGDDVPPLNSPFRQPESKANLELEQLIQKAQSEKLITIQPFGMTFTGFKPNIKTLSSEKASPRAKVDPVKIKQLEDFVKKINRATPGISATGSPVPRADYQPLIDNLSKKVRLTKSSEVKGEEKNTWIYNYTLSSDFKKVEIDNIQAYANLQNSSGNFNGVCRPPNVLSSSIKPGERCQIEVTIQYPQNWSFKEKKSSGTLELIVNGDMKIEVEEEIQPTPSPRGPFSLALTPSPSFSSPASASPTPSGSPKPRTHKVSYRFPFNQLKTKESINKIVPVEKSLYLYSGLGIFGIILIPLLLAFTTMVPITVTLKMGDKAIAFRLAHNGKITIGGRADFTVEGCDDVVAEIVRKFRRFVLVQKQKGIIPESYNIKDDSLPLKIGEGFSLNIAGEYREFEFLPGNQEYAHEKEKYQEPLIDDGMDEIRY